MMLSRKLFAGIALSSVLLLAACDEDTLQSRIIITDVEDVVMDSHMVGKSTQYTIQFKKDGKKQELDYDGANASTTQDEIEAIQKASSIIDSKEKIQYDLVLSGDSVQTITLSKNRK